MESKILNIDCIGGMRMLPEKHFHTCVTSPPYYGLRDYGHEGQIGLEESPEEYVQKMVEVFREVKRVLRDDGTLWLNLGDSYSGYKGENYGKSKGNLTARTPISDGNALHFGTPQTTGLPGKNLIGIPWKVAFALQADGWYLRQDIIWHKPNPMPESVTDRCTKAHEYIFLLSKSPRYYYDNKAIKTPAKDSSIKRVNQSNWENQKGSDRIPGKSNGPMEAVRFGGNKADGYGTRIHSGNEYLGVEMANKRSVWTVTTKPFKGAHFATFPPDLIEPCILAGSPEGGNVLDPFGGAGTTGLVAQRLGRYYTLFELNPDYIDLAKERILKENKRLYGSNNV